MLHIRRLRRCDTNAQASMVLYSSGFIGEGVEFNIICVNLISTYKGNGGGGKENLMYDWVTTNISFR